MSDDDLKPTAEDLARDLAADLTIALSQDYGTGWADDALPAAIRRAMAAEAEVARLRQELRDSEEAYEDAAQVMHESDRLRARNAELEAALRRLVAALGYVELSREARDLLAQAVPAGREGGPDA